MLLTYVFPQWSAYCNHRVENALTGQTHENAIKQYMQDRKTKGEKSLEFKRILVHFACGTEQVFMTTRLSEEKTRFFPFNMFFENKPPKGVEFEVHAVRSEYLWRDVLRKDSLIDLIQTTFSFKRMKIRSTTRRQANSKLRRVKP